MSCRTLMFLPSATLVALLVWAPDRVSASPSRRGDTVTLLSANECSSRGGDCLSDNEPQNAMALFQKNLQKDVFNASSHAVARQGDRNPQPGSGSLPSSLRVDSTPLSPADEQREKLSSLAMQGDYNPNPSSGSVPSALTFLRADSTPLSPADEQREKFSSLALCLCLLMFLCMAWTLNFVKKDLFPPEGVLYIVLVSASYCAASISMATLNKVCVSLTQAPSILTFIQMAFTVVATLALEWREVIGADRSKLLWWCISPVFYACMLNSSMLVYKYMSLSLMIVFRNLSPLVSMTLERFVVDEQHAPKVTLPVVLAILLTVIGAILYTAGESDASWLGLAIVLLNTLLSMTSRLIQRRLLVSECKDLPVSACVTLNNSVGMLPTIAMAMAMHEVQTIPVHQAAWTDPVTLALIGLSAVVGMAIAFCGIKCQKAMTATSFGVVQNLAKILLVSVSVCLFGDNMDSLTRKVGMVLSIVGGLAYGFACAPAAAGKGAGSDKSEAK